MTATWFVDNGFDLSVGFKTGYQEFIKAYLRGRIPGRPPAGRSRPEKRAIRKGKSMIRRHMRKKIINWSDMELALGECTDYYADTDKSRAEFTALRHDLEDSLSQYLRLTTRMGEKDWIRPERSREIAGAFRRVLENPPQGLEDTARGPCIRFGTCTAQGRSPATLSASTLPMCLTAACKLTSPRAESRWAMEAAGRPLRCVRCSTRTAR